MAYKTSELYKEAINKSSKVTHISGTLTTKNKEIQIENSILGAGSLYITNQCVNGDAFQFGSVFSAETSLTLKTEIDRYSLFNAKLILEYNILLSNNEYETIPLGEFYVNEPTRIGKNITIKCYDKMINLSKQVTESTEGKPYDLLCLISERCDVELSQTQEEIEALTNGTKLLSVENDRIDTYRDLLSYIGLVTCTFAYIDRFGKLRLSEFSTTPSKEIIPRLRTTSKFSDFQSYHTSVTAKFIENSTYKPYTSVLDDNSGLLYKIGDCPVVQGLDTSNQETLDNILQTLTLIRYTPGEFTFNGDPSIDLGDMLTCTELEGTKINTLVTYYKWTYRGGHQIKSAGLNPRLSYSTESKNKDLANIEAELRKKNIPVYSATNSADIKVKGGTDISNYTRILRLSCAIDETTTLMLMFNCHFTMDYDGYVEFLTYVDGVLYDNSNIIQYCMSGDNDISFMNYLICDAGSTCRVTIYARTYYDETPYRVQQAQIETNKNAQDAMILAYEKLIAAVKEGTISGLNETITYDEVLPIEDIPTMVIPSYHSKLIIFGQGLATGVSWDGTLEFTEMFDMPVSISTNELTVANFIDSVASETHIPIPGYSISDSFASVQILTNEITVL